MSPRPAYPFDIPYSSRYAFEAEARSEVEKSITKVVDFSFTGLGFYVSIGLGDLRTDGTLDEEALAGSGNVGRLLSTLIEIFLDYTGKFPKAVLVVTGIDDRRTQLYWKAFRLYGRILKRHFRISGLIEEQEGYTECVFNSMSEMKYSAFLLRRKTPAS